MLLGLEKFEKDLLEVLIKTICGSRNTYSLSPLSLLLKKPQNYLIGFAL